jgi:hypothetical protein
MGPEAHIAGGQRHVAVLLAAPQFRRGCFQVLGALQHPAFEFLIELLQGAGLAKQLGEHPHLGAQQLRHHRHRQIIHRTGLIAAQIVGFRHVNRGNEDDRRFLEAGMSADHLRQLETVQVRHADIDQHDRDFGFQQIGQGFVGRGDGDQVLVQLGEHDLVAEQLSRLIVHKQDIDAIFV